MKSSESFHTQIVRIIDANYNRVKEGLRVCEDTMRLAYNDRNNSKKLKFLKQRITTIFNTSKLPNKELIRHRNSATDVGKYDFSGSKASLPDIFIANSQRVKEALRVLEECMSLLDTKTAKRFQKIRFEMYELEKKCLTKIDHLCRR